MADDTSIFCNEVLAPVLSVYSSRPRKRAVQRANDTKYGLYATVWMGNLSRVHGVGNELDAGTLTVYEFPVISPQATFGGYKDLVSVARRGFRLSRSMHN